MQLWIFRGKEEPLPHPLFEPHLLGLRSRRLDLCLTVLIVGIVLASRLAALPATIWEQDEAYFGSAVVSFDATHNHPHPPWFPLWIATGKVLEPLAGEPVRGLEVASLVASTWILFPLVSLWSLWMRRRLALAAAGLFLFLPGPWYLSARAFSEPSATALLVLTAALWLRQRPRGGSIVAGSVSAGLCLAIRAHFVAAVAGLVVVRLLRGRSRRETALTLAPAAAVLGLSYGAVVWATGGVRPLIRALEQHAAYHFGALGKASLSFADSGLARAVLTPELAVLWIGLAALGLVMMWRRRERLPGAAALAAAVLAPLIVTVHGLAWGGHLRYSLPIVAFSSGLVVVGLATVLGRWSLPLLAGLLVASAVVMVPVLAEYRRTPSPPEQALGAVLSEAARSGSVIVADRTLVSFIDYRRLTRGIPFTVLWDDQVRSGQTVAPPAWATVAISDAGHGDFVLSSRTRRTFSCNNRWLRRLSQGRFLDLTVYGVAQTGREGPIGSGASSSRRVYTAPELEASR